MKRIADVVNLNADASCLAAATWLDALEGGEDSQVCRWLRGYVDHGRKVTLGIVGATAVDMASRNPESIALVNAHPDVFETILRPYSHDIALLRNPEGFSLNVQLGASVLTDEFDAVTPWLLAPEFMLTSQQVRQLGGLGVAGTFINAGRFSKAVASRIPARPYRLTGLQGATLDCIPVAPELTGAYLDSLHEWEASAWNACVRRDRRDTLCSWRDGESWLFVPDGVRRERDWLAEESDEVERVFVRDLAAEAKFEDPACLDPRAFASHPVHPFSDWVGEFRMFGFLRRLMDLELRLDRLSREERLCWLQAANSDVLSAVEKPSPRIRLRTGPPTDPRREEVSFEIPRSERGFEGEEYLALAERYSGSAASRHFVAESEQPHIVKLRTRIEYFAQDRIASTAARTDRETA